VKAFKLAQRMHPIQVKRAQKKFKPLKITARGNSGLSDVSENHDYYFALVR
jgi:hypothetical protein